MRLKVPASKSPRGVAGMLKKYISKFAMDIFPSVAATIIGAYIVNHYIATKPAANAPAAAVSTAEPQAEAKPLPEAAKAGSKAAETSADVTNLPEPGIKAKGISEKAMIEKTAAEKPIVVEKPAEKSADKPAEKSADKPAETASIPAGTRRHQPTPREKAVAKAVPAPVPPAASVSTPVVAAPATVPAPPAEAAIVPEERRDANDLARAAIERLRGANDGSPRAQEAARVPEAPRAQDPPRVVSASPVRPLPPPIMVSTPPTQTFDSSGSSQMRPPYAARIDDPRRPTPPADIPAASPSSPPLDLHAEADETSRRGHTTVAEDVLSAAKSVFHAVLPKKLTD
jgi:hypothetical protein